MSEQVQLNTDITQDYFAFFSLEKLFDINLNILEEHFRAIQSASHPDRFVTANASEKRASMQLATFANSAYLTLKHPESRAKYLLELHGIEAVAETNTAMPASFLMQQMEWREAIEDAKQANNISALDALLADMHAEAKSLYVNIRQYIDIEKNYIGAVNDVRKLIFINKVCADMRQVIAHLEDA